MCSGRGQGGAEADAECDGGPYDGGCGEAERGAGEVAEEVGRGLVRPEPGLGAREPDEREPPDEEASKTARS